VSFPKEFLLGASTAAHQVEGNNKNSDFWVMENLPHSQFAEPSGDACDHYRRYEEDILLLKEAGLNAYRFSIEWARIEPEEGRFDMEEVAHYRRMLEFCRSNGVEPVVTLHHFTSPAWLISRGGWASEDTVRLFARYCRFVTEQLGSLLHRVCTINEANMGLQLSAIMQRMLRRMGIHMQVGMKIPLPREQQEGLTLQAQAFGLTDPSDVHPFLTMGTAESDALVLRAHAAAREAIKDVNPALRVGLTLSLHHFDVREGGEEIAARRWEEEFTHYLPVIGQDDFLGIQNYTREIIGPDGPLPVPEGSKVTQMGYEVYPQALALVLRRVHEQYPGELLVTENGIGTDDDSQRIDFIRDALAGVGVCVADGIPVIGYLHWSLLDNFEWQMGFARTFGLIAVDRSTQTRLPKPSLAFLGSFAGK